MHSSVNLEGDGLTADCDMSNKNTFSKYFVRFLKEEKHWNTEQISVKHWIFFKLRNVHLMKDYFPSKNIFSFSFKVKFRGTRSLEIYKYFKFWD